MTLVGLSDDSITISESGKRFQGSVEGVSVSPKNPVQRQRKMCMTNTVAEMTK